MNLVVLLTVITILTLNAGNATPGQYYNKGCDDRPAFKKELSETCKKELEIFIEGIFPYNL